MDSSTPRGKRCRGDEGAVLVEFAIIAPILFALIFGVIEFGWAFYQNLDVRHGAREGVRLAAVNSNPTNSETTQQERIAREVCDRMDLDGTVELAIDVDPTVVVPTTSGDIGDEVTFRVRKDLDQLTGFFGFALDGVDLDSSVKTRLEQNATYADLPIGTFTC